MIPGIHTGRNVAAHNSHLQLATGRGYATFYWKTGGKGRGTIWFHRMARCLTKRSSPSISVVNGSGDHREHSLLDFGTFPRTGSWSDRRSSPSTTPAMARWRSISASAKASSMTSRSRTCPQTSPFPRVAVSTSVIFQTSTIGPRQATLRIYSDDPDEPTTEVLVLGFGAPVCSGVTRADASPTAATSVRFHVKFTEDVSGVNAADFTLVESGVSGSSIAQVADVDEGNPGTAWVLIGLSPFPSARAREPSAST